MKLSEYQKIAHLEGLDFIQAVLRIEERAFKLPEFLKGSTFEDINSDFGIFPSVPVYPVYFAGDILQPTDKIIFIGINPGYNKEDNRREQEFLRSRGLYEGYCRIFSDFFGLRGKQGLIPYYANIAGFLRRYCEVTERIDWDWFQQHFITLELIPYHSVNANGLRINDLSKYRHVYFETILKILRYLDPQQPIFINGFLTFRSLIEINGALRPEFRGVMKFSMSSNVAIGTRLCENTGTQSARRKSFLILSV
jgi:hypothetical protein